MNEAPKYRQAVTASGVYFLFQALRMAGGFISMPVLTRALTKEEYGLLNVTLATVGILAMVGRLGFAEATTRFYYERSQQGLRELREFCGTMLGGSLFSSALVAIITLIVLQWVTLPENTVRCLRAACLVVVIRAVLSVIYQIYRAEERAVAFSIVQIAARYASLAAVIAILLVYGLTAYQVIVATVIGEGLVALVCFWDFASRGIFGRPALSRWQFNAAFLYGLPLAVGTYGTFLLDYGDRFLIERYLGLSAVATYSVPYDLVGMLAATVFGSIKLALLPVIFRIWESEGPEATSKFVSQVLSYSLALAIPGAVLFVMTSEDLIVLLTSAKYADSGALTAYLLPGIFIGEMNFLVAVGLLVNNGTIGLAVLTLLSTALNVVLNVLFLPRWGLIGAAWATTIAYAMLMLTTYLLSRRSLELRIKPVVLGATLLATAVMVLSVTMLGRVSARPAADFFARATVGAGIAGLCMSLLDPEIRQRTWLRGVRSIRDALGTTV